MSIREAIEAERKILLETIKELDELKEHIDFALSDIDNIETSDDAIEWAKRHEAIDKEYKYIEIKEV